MLQKTVPLSPRFKSQVGKSILSIVVFIIVFLVLAIGSTVLTAFCVYLGLQLILTVQSFLTLILGAGIASFGFLILAFLFKFLFSSKKEDRSDLIQITEQDEPQLFAIIREIVGEVGTQFPKGVYLCPDVNAAVFYDSSFWTMFFPVKKNLKIGLGLINGITDHELKAVLSHEFGHFSQRSMKVGAYVHNVNQIIFNMLYDNDSYQRMIANWASMGTILSIIVSLVVRVVQVIQWILEQMYALVNLNYMALSREMEFHADEIAAHIMGYVPLKTSLLRMSLVTQAYDNVMAFYEEETKHNRNSENLYPEHSFVIHFMGKENNLAVSENFPQVSAEEVEKYNTSKLMVDQQWSSHPTLEERISHLEKTNLKVALPEGKPANTIFKNLENHQKKITAYIFQDVKYSGPKTTNTINQFEAAYVKKVKENSFSPIYNGYYDSKDPEKFDLTIQAGFNYNHDLDSLFSNDKIEKIYGLLGLENDINLLMEIVTKGVKVKSFDYDGKRYKSGQASHLVVRLNKEKKNLVDAIAENDRNIFNYFFQLELKSGKEPTLKKQYQNLLEAKTTLEERFNVGRELSNATGFIQVQLPFEEIQHYLTILRDKERPFRRYLQTMASEQELLEMLGETEKFQVQSYLKIDWKYFTNNNYDEEKLEMLFNAIAIFEKLMQKAYLLEKKKVLNYQSSLVEGKS